MIVPALSDAAPVGPPLYSASVTPAQRAAILRFVSSLSPEQQRRLATMTPAQAAQFIPSSFVAALSGDDDGLGWINFVIQAAAAVYGAKKAKDAKKKQKKQQQQAEAQARAEEEAERKAAEEEAKKAAAAKAARESTVVGKIQAMPMGTKIAIGAGALAGVGLLTVLAVKALKRK